LGPVYNANVSLYQAATIDFTQHLSSQTGLLLDSTTTNGTDGTFTGLDAGNYTGPLLLVVSVNANSSYYDESGAASNGAVGLMSFDSVDLNNLLPANTFFPDSKSAHHLLFALLPEPELDDGVGVTTLTTMATMLASSNHANGVDAAQVRDYNKAVTETFFREFPDSISIEPTTFDSNIATDSLDYSGDNDYTRNDMYALVLAVLADMGTGSYPALMAHRSLLEDGQDGKIDDLDGVFDNFTEFYSNWQELLLDYTDVYATNALEAKLILKSYILPRHQILTCDGVANGEHDGICAKIDGEYRNAMTSNYTGRYALETDDRLEIKYVDTTPGSTNKWLLELPVNITGPVTTDCNSSHQLKIQGDPVDATLEPLSDCQITYQKVGRVVSGNFISKLQYDSNSYDVMDGHFRVTLPESDDSITGLVDGDDIVPDPGWAFVQSYQPKKYIHLISTTISADKWEIIIDDLGRAPDDGSQITNTNCKPANVEKGTLSYIRASSSALTVNTNDVTNHDCEIKYSINNGVLEGTFTMTQVKIVTGSNTDLSPIFHLGDASGSFKAYLPDGPNGYPSTEPFN